jgi:uncharacterized protein with HEPN domain
MQSRSEVGRRLAEQASEIVALIERVHGRGKRSYQEDELLRLALQRLWIAMGNCLESYRVSQEIPRGVHPYKDAYGKRNFLAHAALDEINQERVWYDSQSDLPQIKALVEGWRREAGGWA